MLHVYYCLKNKCCPGEELVARDAEARIPPKAGKYPVRALHWRDARPLGAGGAEADADPPSPSASHSQTDSNRQWTDARDAHIEYSIGTREPHPAFVHRAALRLPRQ